MYNVAAMAFQAGDVELALDWYQKSAGLGDRDAMFNLGALAEGAGDLGVARHWYELAAKAGEHAR